MHERHDILSRGGHRPNYSYLRVLEMGMPTMYICVNIRTCKIVYMMLCVLQVLSKKVIANKLEWPLPMKKGWATLLVVVLATVLLSYIHTLAYVHTCTCHKTEIGSEMQEIKGRVTWKYIRITFFKKNLDSDSSHSKELTKFLRSFWRSKDTVKNRPQPPPT